MTPADFARAYGSLADQAAARTHVNRWVILAQWAVETGWGGSALCVAWHNLAGIRWYGRTVQARQLGGIAGRAGTGFAGYASLDAFLSDYAYVMGLPYYAGVRSAPTIPGTIMMLGQSPWDAGHYLSGGIVGGSVAYAYRLLAASAPSPVPAPAARRYTVVHGDTLWGIATRYYGHGTLFGRIATANRIPAPYVIHVGQVLVIP